MKTRAELERELADAVLRQRSSKRELGAWRGEDREAERRARESGAVEEAARPSPRCRALQREIGRQRAALRALLLAHGLVCGRAYWAQERRTRRPVAGVLEALARCADVSVDEARGWVETPVSDAARAAFEAHRGAVAARARERRERARSASVRGETS